MTSLDPDEIVTIHEALDKLEAAFAAERTDVVEAVVSNLKADLATLPQNNVVVSEARKTLAKVQDDQFWSSLSLSDVGFLRNNVAPVLRARPGIDIKAMRFETEAVELGTALLAENADQVTAIRDSLIAQIDELPLSVNVVAREKELIEQTKETAFWATPTEEKVRSLVTALSPLMRFRQRKTESFMTLDIEDLTVVKDWIEFGPENERMSTRAYRERVEQYVRELVEQDPVVAKIANGEEVGEAEIMSLARTLKEHDPEVTEELLRKVYDHKTARFIQFIKHILGLEKLESWQESVNHKFESFIAEHNTFTALQIRFLQTLKTFILQTGKVEKKDLIAAPFTQIHPSGVRGVFNDGEIDEIINFTKGFVA